MLLYSAYSEHIYLKLWAFPCTKLPKKIVYTRVQNVCPGWKTARNQGNQQNFDPTLPTKKLWPFNMRMKEKKKILKFYFLKWPPKKSLFFKITNSWNYFAKFLGLVLGLVGWIDAKGIDLTYILVRLSDISSKRAEKL